MAEHRRYTPDKQIARLFVMQEGKCIACPEKLFAKPRNFIIEHITALALGGLDTFENKELRCHYCARAKTIGTGATTAGSDIGKIAKLKRLEAKRLGTKPAKPKRQWASRPFPSRPFPKRP